jgi:hypothetical protein
VAVLASATGSLAVALIEHVDVSRFAVQTARRRTAQLFVRAKQRVSLVVSPSQHLQASVIHSIHVGVWTFSGRGKTSKSLAHSVFGKVRTFLSVLDLQGRCGSAVI